MKNVLFVFIFLIFANCNTQKKYSDFDYSFSRSGGKIAIYENLLIKGNNAHYSLDGPEKKMKKDFTLSDDELKRIENILSQNDFRKIQEDYKKVYDHVSTAINVKNGPNSGRKSDASFIMEKDKKRWKAILNTFEQIINTNIQETASEK